jgi:hypothetical protein
MYAFNLLDSVQHVVYGGSEFIPRGELGVQR